MSPFIIVTQLISFKLSGKTSLHSILNAKETLIVNHWFLSHEGSGTWAEYRGKSIVSLTNSTQKEKISESGNLSLSVWFIQDNETKIPSGFFKSTS